MQDNRTSKTPDRCHRSGASATRSTDDRFVAPPSFHCNASTEGHREYLARISAHWPTVHALLQQARADGCSDPVVVVAFDLDSDDLAKGVPGRLGHTTVTIGDRGRFVEVGKRIVACSQMTEEERALELAQIEIVEHPPKFVASVGILLGALGRIVPVHYSGPKGHNSCWTIDPVDVPAVNAVGGVA